METIIRKEEEKGKDNFDKIFPSVVQRQPGKSNIVCLLKVELPLCYSISAKSDSLGMRLKDQYFS